MRIRAKLTLLLILLGASAVLATSWIAYVHARSSLTERVLAQLTSVREAERAELQTYFQAVFDQARIISESRETTTAMSEFRDAVEAMDGASAPPGLRDEVDGFYRKSYLPSLSKLMTPRTSPEEYLPHGRAPYLLQHWYVVSNRHPRGRRAEIAEANDGSRYSRAHAEFHPDYRRTVQRFHYADLYLIDGSTGRIVYSVNKEPDFGTSLKNGPYRNSGLAKVFGQCSASDDPDSVFLSDFEVYEPSLGAPAAFICSPVFSAGRNIGVFAVQLSIHEIDRAISGDQNWEKCGLGKTGESRVVGPDLLMRSNARGYIENPEDYIRLLQSRGVPSKTVDKIRAYGTTVLQLDLRLNSVASALEGREGTMPQESVTGQAGLVSYAPLGVPGLKWSIEARMDEAEALGPVFDLRRRLMRVTLLVLLGLALAASIMGRRLVRPIQMLADASGRLANGDLAVRVPAGPRDEIGVLSASFNAMAASIEEKTIEIRRKNQENESLLLNILPSPIADRLKSGESRIADSFGDVTVLFADIVDFTILSSRRPPDETVEFLNDLFSRFDLIAQRAGVEKIKTIGDAYMAVAGLPDACDDHARKMVDMAVEMMEEVRRIRIATGVNLALRIGINSGPVVAGVIGTSKFIYDLWGDTVNVASRMESHGIPGGIQVTRPVYERLHGEYPFEWRGEIEVKGKGRMEAWLLTAEKTVAV